MVDENGFSKDNHAQSLFVLEDDQESPEDLIGNLHRHGLDKDLSLSLTLRLLRMMKMRVKETSLGISMSISLLSKAWVIRKLLI